jgi:hypothetical protein
MLAYQARFGTLAPNIQILSLVLSLFWHHSDMAMRTTAARYFGALKKALRSLEQYYEVLESSASLCRSSGSAGFLILVVTCLRTLQRAGLSTCPNYTQTTNSSSVGQQMLVSSYASSLCVIIRRHTSNALRWGSCRSCEALGRFLAGGIWSSWTIWTIPIKTWRSHHSRLRFLNRLWIL